MDELGFLSKTIPSVSSDALSLTPMTTWQLVTIVMRCVKSSVVRMTWSGDKAIAPRVLIAEIDVDVVGANVDAHCP